MGVVPQVPTVYEVLEELAITPNPTLPWRQVIRKERAVGVVPQVPTVYEVLEELAITVQNQMIDTRLPFCAFNGASASH